MNIVEFIKKSPKAELHLHIEGTLEPNHMFELAKRNNVQIPFTSIDEVKFAYNFSNLESFFVPILKHFNLILEIGRIPSLSSTTSRNQMVLEFLSLIISCLSINSLCAQSFQ